MSGVYVRAKTIDNQWASVDAVQLDNESFREFVLMCLVRGGLVNSVIGENIPTFRTNLPKEECE